VDTLMSDMICCLWTLSSFVLRLWGVEDIVESQLQ